MSKSTALSRSLLPLAVLATAFALTACGQAAQPRVDPTGVTYTGAASGLSTSDGSDGSTDVEDADDVEDSGDTSVTVPGSPRAGQPAPTEVTTEQVVGPVARLEVATDAGGVTVIGSDAPGVTVVRSIYREPVAPVETVRHDGDLLHIESECPQDDITGPCRIDYEITVPRATAVAIGGASGDLATSGLTGALTARSASGSILLGEHQGPTTVANTVSGDVQVKLGNRPVSVEATSVSGGVQVIVPDAGPYRIQTSTVSGETDVDVRSDPGARSTISVRTTSGDLSVGTG